ncbi:MAG: 3-hydroxyacyl-CoA dehydrogenase NAD-binding domain-containing protein [Limnohabitans sp.]
MVVIGTGTMGVGIAADFIAAGVPLVLLGRTQQKAAEVLHRAVELAGDINTQLTPPISAMAGALEEWNDWRDVAWVLETVKEDFEIKRSLFAHLDHCLPAHIPIGTNSSGFSVTRLSAGLPTRNRMFNAHYFMPAHLVPLVEIALGCDSSLSLAEEVCAMYRRMGKKPVLVRQDIPGLLANRIQHALMREALDLIDRGIATPEDVDTAVRFSFGFRYAAAGPVLQKEISGWDSMARAAEEIYPSLTNTHQLAQCVQTNIQQGKTGMKAGAGFETWSADQVSKVRRDYDLRLKAAFDVLKMP